MKRVFVYSHGFGVQKDDRGMFADIAAALPDFHHVLFDYNLVDREHNTLTLASFTQQKEMLAQVLRRTRSENPNAEISLICHSQGCITAALVSAENIARTIFITPPSEISIDRVSGMFAHRKGAVLDINAVSSFPRRDGSVTIVPKEYWNDIENIDPQDLYSRLAQKTKLTLITAENDEVLGTTDFSRLIARADVMTLPGNHDFAGEFRQELKVVIARIFMRN